MYRGDERHKRGSDRADVDGRTCWHVAIALHFDSAVIIIISIYHQPPLLAPLWALISLKMRPGTIIANSSQVKQVVARRVTGSGRPAGWLADCQSSLSALRTVSRYRQSSSRLVLFHRRLVPRTGNGCCHEGMETATKGRKPNYPWQTVTRNRHR
jgi:hypothetical protein